MNNLDILNGFKHETKAKTIYELQKQVRDYIELSQKTQLERQMLQDKISSLYSSLIEGIIIKKDSFFEEIINNVITYLEKYGYSKEEIYNSLKTISFSTTDIKAAFNHNGLAQSSAYSIIFDLSLIKFDEEGKFKSFDYEKYDEETIKYIITHELLHKISLIKDKDNKKNITAANDSAISEGLTDYFARDITGYDGPNKSKVYQFSVNICSIFVALLGKDKVLSDYIDNFGTYPNIQNLFSKYNINFNNFLNKLDLALAKRYNQDKEEEIAIIEQEIVTILKDNLIKPYIKEHPEKKEELEVLFNKLNIPLYEEIKHKR